MLRCKQVHDVLSQKNYWELPLHQRIGLRMHVALCLICGPFNRFIMLFQDATRLYRQHEVEDTPAAGMCLSAAARERIRERLKKEWDATAKDSAESGDEGSCR